MSAVVMMRVRMAVSSRSRRPTTITGVCGYCRAAIGPVSTRARWFKCPTCRTKQKIDPRSGQFVAQLSNKQRRSLKNSVSVKCGGCGVEITGVPIRRQRFNCPSCSALHVLDDKKGHYVVRIEAKPGKKGQGSKLPIPVRKEIVVTGRYQLDDLVSRGLLPKPSQAMRMDMARKGIHFRRKYAVRLGDFIYRLSRIIGIPTCTACQRRRVVLNRIVVWGWWR